MTTSSRSSCAKSSTRFTQNGRSVPRAIERICSRSTAGSVHDAPSVPSPPARDTSLGAAPRRPGRAAPASAETPSPARSPRERTPATPAIQIHPSAKKITTLAVAAPLYAAVDDGRGTAHGRPALRSAAVLDACNQARMQKPVRQGWPHIGGRSDAWIGAICVSLLRCRGLGARAAPTSAETTASRRPAAVSPRSGVGVRSRWLTGLPTRASHAVSLARVSGGVAGSSTHARPAETPYPPRVRATTSESAPDCAPHSSPGRPSSWRTAAPSAGHG